MVTAMNFPQEDRFWKSVADFLFKRFGEGASLLAPNEFHEIFPRSFPYDVAPHLDLRTLDALVIHRGMLDEVGKGLCRHLLENGIPLLGNEVFAVYTLKGRRPWRLAGKEHFDDFRAKVDLGEVFKINPAKLHSEFEGPATVILMTTYNRPDRLARTLESVSLLRAPILVVNDGSDSKHSAAYESVSQQFGVRVINMPDNRGLSNALNAGLSYWLADPQVCWISYIQDDMEVRPDMLAALARVQDPVKYPLLTGRLNPLHKIYGKAGINGIEVVFQRMSPGLHLHAHRSYWEKILPIPTAYFQAPRPCPGAPRRGADEDWWIVQWSPRSIVKQCKYVAVLPGLARTTAVLASESTWDNPGMEEPPLPPPQVPVEDFVPAVFRSK